MDSARPRRVALCPRRAKCPAVALRRALKGGQRRSGEMARRGYLSLEQSPRQFVSGGAWELVLSLAKELVLAAAIA
jgi:hypothetical protein